MRWSVVLAMGGLITLAGCLGAGDDAIDPAATPDMTLDVEAYALPLLVQDHEHHTAHDEHVGMAGFEHVGYAAGRPGTYPAGEVYTEIAVKAGHAFVAFGPRGGFVAPNTEAGFIVYDVSDPASPRELGRWLGQPLGDIEASDDGAWAFAGTQRNGYPYPWVINPAAGPLGQAPRGIYVLDVSDKASPRVSSFTPLPPNGPHTITYHQMPDGRELLLAATYDFVWTNYPQNLGQATVTQKVLIYEVETQAAGRVLNLLSIFQIPQPDEGADNYFPHDATVHVNPSDGRVIMDVAYWDLGLVMVDITNPSAPREIARFADTGPASETNTHLVRVFPGTIDGRVVAVLQPEISGGPDDGQYTFVDVTEPENPVKLGYWSLPGEHVIDQPFVFSPHNFDLVCGGDGQVTGRPIDYAAPCADPTVVLAHFHGGLWALDASDPANARAIGYYFPAVTREDVQPGFPFTGFFSAIVSDGHVFAPEAWTGLHVVRLPA